MANKSLVEELGSRYVTEYFQDALFRIDNTLYRFKGVADNNKILTDALDLMGKGEDAKFKSTWLDASILKDFATFKYPKMGYRQLQQGKLGNIVVWINTIRSVQRGLKETSMQITHLPVFDILRQAPGAQSWDHIHSSRRIREIFQPTFTPFTVGLKQIAAGDIAGFAVSEDLAVGVACVTEANRGYDIYWRGRVVGNVDEAGQINIVNKILQRESIKRKLFQ